MVNVLGQHVMPLSNSIAKYPEWSLHLYGKAEAKVNRKMVRNDYDKRFRSNITTNRKFWHLVRIEGDTQ